MFMFILQFCTVFSDVCLLRRIESYTYSHIQHSTINPPLVVVTLEKIQIIDFFMVTKMPNLDYYAKTSTNSINYSSRIRQKPSYGRRAKRIFSTIHTLPKSPGRGLVPIIAANGRGYINRTAPPLGDKKLGIRNILTGNLCRKNAEIPAPKKITLKS